MSTRMCRLRPLISCPHRSPKDQAQTPFLSALRGLRVDDRHRRACFTSLLLALRHVQRVMDALQGAVPVPELEIVVHRALRRQVFGQRLPLASGPEHVENPVQDFAHVDRAFASTVSRRRDHRHNNGPFVSDRLDNAGPCGPRRGDDRVSTWGAPSRIWRPTRNHIRFIRLKNFPDRLSDENCTDRAAPVPT